MTMITRNFFEGESFSPFTFNETGNGDDYIDRYLGPGAFMGNYAQLAVEHYLNTTLEGNVKVVAAYANRANYYGVDSVLPEVMDNIFPVFLVLLYTFPVLYILQKAVEEKQNKTRESMRMMGMHDSPYWASWFLVFAMLNFMTSIIMTIGTFWTLFPDSNFFLLF